MRMNLLLFSIGILLSGNLLSQWQADIRLTNDVSSSYTSYNNADCIAVSGAFVHIVWRDDRNSVDQIYYKRSTDGGDSWGTDTRITFSSAACQYPSIAVSDAIVHIVWYDQRDGNNEIYYKRSNDNGETWGSDVRLTNNSSYSAFPSIIVSGSIVHIVWFDNRDANDEIYYKRSTDGGNNWGADTRLSNSLGLSQFPCISAFGSKLIVVWEDNRDGNSEIYFKGSNDSGLNWNADARLTNNLSISASPSVNISSNRIFVAWNDDRDGNTEIYYKISTNSGVNWQSDVRLTNNPSSSLYPAVESSGSIIHITWQDLRDGNYELYYNRSLNSGINWESDTRLTSNMGNSILPSIALSGNSIQVLWHDLRDGNYEIYYKRNPSGNPTGIKTLNSTLPTIYVLSQNYPNPFNPTTNFEFRIADFGFVNLTIYDAMGRVIETLQNGELKPGVYKAEWNASGYPSGVYFYKLSAGSFTETNKMILAK